MAIGLQSVEKEGLSVKAIAYIRTAIAHRWALFRGDRYPPIPQKNI